MGPIVQFLPSGSTVPPAPYLAGLLAGVLVVAGLLARRRPAVTPRVVTAFAPWMVAGAILYALYQVEVVPGVVRPLLGSPAVYLTTFTVAGLLWVGLAGRPADRWSPGSVPGVLALIGTTVVGLLLAAAIGVGVIRGTLAVVAPLVALVAAVALGVVAWLATAVRLRLGVTGPLGPLAVLGHAIDGVSTALGRLLGYAEQTPLSRLVLELGAAAPLPVVGGGWLFVLVKLALALAVTYLLADYCREDRGRGALLLGFVAAVGLGPGVHNLVLFAMTAG